MYRLYSTLIQQWMERDQGVTVHDKCSMDVLLTSIAWRINPRPCHHDLPRFRLYRNGELSCRLCFCGKPMAPEE